MALRSIAHLPGRIDSEEFQRYFLYLLEQVRRERNASGAMLLSVAVRKGYLASLDLTPCGGSL